MNGYNVEQSKLFHVGQVVDAPGFKDCFGKDVPTRRGYVIRSITAIADKDCAYYRLDTYSMANPFARIEGAERYFIPGVPND